MSLKTVCLSPSILTPPHGTGRKENSLHKWCPTDFFSFSCHLVAQGKISRHTSLLVLDRLFRVFLFLFFHAAPWHRAEVLDPQLDRSSTDFLFSLFFFPRHLVAQSRSPQHAARSVLDRFFFYATSWRRAEVLDTLLDRSSTDFSFSFFFCHLVARSRSPRRTAQTVHATMWPDKQNGAPLWDEHRP